MPFLRILAIAALSASTVAVASATGGLVVNGDFEAGGPIAAWRSVPAGSRGIAGWRVVAGYADVVGRYWQAYDGAQSLEIGTPGAGAVEQTIATVPGHRYALSFAMAGNPDGAPRVKLLDVGAGGVTRRFTFDTGGRTRAAMGWAVQRMSFTAAASATTLRFARPDGGGTAWWGPAVDAVTVTDVTGAAENAPATPSPVPMPTSAPATVPPPVFLPHAADPYSGLWRAAYGSRSARIFIERRGTSITGHTVGGDSGLTVGAIAFTGRYDGVPIVLLGKCADPGATGWHGAVLEWTAADTFHLHVADCHTGDVLYTRWR